VFKDELNRVSLEKNSRIILALDPSALPRDLTQEQLKSRAIKILRDVSPYICGVKINMQLLLPLGLYYGVKEIIDLAHNFGLPVIMDCKLSDVGHTNAWATRHYFEAGFDAMIINPIIGWAQGAEPIFQVAKEYGGRGIILLVYTTHKAAPESYELLVKDPVSGREIFLYELFARRALEWNADGAIVGGTYPEKIKIISSILQGKVPIFSPGIGVQGGRIKACLEAGTKYFIIGRSIFNAENPAEAAKFFRDLALS